MVVVFAATEVFLATINSYNTDINCDPSIVMQLTSLRFAFSFTWCLHDVQTERDWTCFVLVAGAPQKFDLICVRCCVRRGWEGMEGGLQILFTSAPVWRTERRLFRSLVWTLNETLSWLFWIRWASTASLRPVWLCDLVVEGKLCNSWLWSLQWLLGKKKLL